MLMAGASIGVTHKQQALRQLRAPPTTRCRQPKECCTEVQKSVLLAHWLPQEGRRWMSGWGGVGVRVEGGGHVLWRLHSCSWLESCDIFGACARGSSLVQQLYSVRAPLRCEVGARGRRPVAPRTTKRAHCANDCL